MPSPFATPLSGYSRLSFRSLSLLALLVALIASSPAFAGPGTGPVPRFLGLTFQQVDWLEAPGVPVLPDSSWGAMSLAYQPVRKTWYLNGAAKLPGSRRESWFLRNLPLFGERNPRVRREAVFLDLRRLGLAERTDLRSMQIALTLDSALRTTAPPMHLGQIFPVGVRELLLQDALGLASVERPAPGAPRPILIKRKTKEEVRRVVRPVQERPGESVAGAFARSLDWLNQEFGFQPELSAQDIYEGLTEVGVSTAEDENGNGPIDEWLDAKNDFAFLFSHGRIETSVWDGADMIPPVEDIPEEDGDFLEWLDAELDRKADVEIVVDFPGGRSVFMLTGKYTAGEKTFVRYRYDDKPWDGFLGDEEEFTGEIFVGPDGKYRLGSSDWEIGAAFSEAVVR